MKSENLIIQIFKGIVSGIYSLHNEIYEKENKGIIHRDLKPANILLTKELDPVIIGFGGSKVSNNI